MRYINNLFFISICLFLWNCTTNNVTHKKSDIPDWYLEVPTSKDYLYGIESKIKNSKKVKNEG